MTGCFWGRGLAAALLFAVPTVQAEVSFYVSGALGFASTADFEDTINSGYPFADSVLNVTFNDVTRNVAAPQMDADDYNVGGNAFVGMRFNQHVSVELMYLTYGEFSAEYRETLVEMDDNNIPMDTLSLSLSGHMEVSGAGLGVRVDAPLSDEFAVFGRLGMYQWQQEVSYYGDVIELVTASTPEPTNSVKSGGESGADMYGAVGIMMWLQDQTWVYAELNKADFGEDEFASSSMGLFLGVHFELGNSGF